ncbi:MAG: N-acetylglucosamine-6-phosphate deacetylase [Chloroflexi bacterium]|nr:N-acetylglucosamine-6-phosphate deacetylase [Chloroflexota bacterium]
MPGKAILNGTVYTPSEKIEAGVVLISGGQIEAVGRQGEVEIPPNTEIFDAAGMAIAPGFVDVHMHGVLGKDCMGIGLAEVIPALPAYGVTSFMATTLTYPRPEVIEALETISEILSSPPSGAHCLGIHLEGPHLSPKRPGMATADWVYPLSSQDFDVLQKAADGRIRMITFAPEEPGAMQAIPALVANGVVPVIGHSDASYEQVAQAVKLGLNHATHTYNAMRPLQHREPGVVGAVMHFDEIYAELIADGVHVHPAAMDILIRVKGLDKVVLISDSAPFAGLPDGEYEWEHKPIFVLEGRCQLADGTLAGAFATLDMGVRNLVNLLGLPLEKALIPATRSAANSVGAHRKGRLEAGCDADIVLLDADIRPAATFVGGRLVWTRP